MPSIPRPPLDGPARRLAVPLVVLSSPPLFFLHRTASTCGTAAGCSTAVLAGYAIAAVLAIPAAVLVARAVANGRAPRWLAPRPDDATLATLAVLVAALGGYLLLGLAGLVGPGAGPLVGAAGLLLALPLAVVNLLVVAAGNALGEPPTVVQLLVVAVGVALSAAWWYVLASGVGRGLARVNDPRD